MRACVRACVRARLLAYDCFELYSDRLIFIYCPYLDICIYCPYMNICLFIAHMSLAFLVKRLGPSAMLEWATINNNDNRKTLSGVCWNRTHWLLCTN